MNTNHICAHMLDRNNNLYKLWIPVIPNRALFASYQRFTQYFTKHIQPIDKKLVKFTNGQGKVLPRFQIGRYV